jgi:hypothetical protein
MQAVSIKPTPKLLDASGAELREPRFVWIATRLASQYPFDLLAYVEPASANLDARQEAATRPVFNGRDWNMEQQRDVTPPENVIRGQPARSRNHGVEMEGFRPSSVRPSPPEVRRASTPS